MSHFEDLYEIRQTTDSPSQYQIWERTKNTLLCTCPTVASLITITGMIRIKLAWSELKAL